LKDENAWLKYSLFFKKTLISNNVIIFSLDLMIQKYRPLKMQPKIIGVWAYCWGKPKEDPRI
jgi:hypothetical protein